VVAAGVDDVQEGFVEGEGQAVRALEVLRDGRSLP